LVVTEEFMNTTELEPALYALCPICDQATFPIHDLSPCGHEAEPVLIPFDDVGEVFSWTRTHGADGPTPIAMTDFLGGELRVTAPVLGVTDIAIGDRLLVRNSADGAFFLVPAGMPTGD
jgi:uncharacterized OB-fold protein